MTAIPARSAALPGSQKLLLPRQRRRQLQFRPTNWSLMWEKSRNSTVSLLQPTCRNDQKAIPSLLPLPTATQPLPIAGTHWHIGPIFERKKEQLANLRSDLVRCSTTLPPTNRCLESCLCPLNRNSTGRADVDTFKRRALLERRERLPSASSQRRSPS